jgi:hypothetical protein
MRFPRIVLRARKESIRMSTSSGIGSLSAVLCHIPEALSHGSTVKTRFDTRHHKILLRRELIVCCALQDGVTPRFHAEAMGHTDMLQLMIAAARAGLGKIESGRVNSEYAMHRQ